MNPGENSGVLSPATLRAALEPLHAEIAAIHARVHELDRQLRRRLLDLPQEIARHVVAALPTDDLMSRDDRQLNTAQAAAFLGVEETWLRLNKQKIGYKKDKARSSPLSFSLGDLKAYNERRHRPRLADPADVRLPPPIYLAKPKPPRQRHATQPARTAGRGAA